MTHAEWLRVGAKVGELWPGKDWPPETMAAAYDLFGKLNQAPALQAIDELAAEGREFAPAPGVVLARALQIVVASTPKLPDVDLTRPLTAEEAERAKRMAAALNGKQAELVVSSWMEFSRHGSGCKACGKVAIRCRQSGLSSARIAPWVSELCVDGRPIFESWRYAVDQLRVMAAPEVGVQQEAAI